MRAVRLFIVFCLLLAVAGGVYVWAGWRSAIEPIERPAADSFDRTLVQRGAELAAIGNCDVCHTAPGGRAFAGGVGLPTPFGTIHSTNITPDVKTGIGNWSEAAFRRAMREGVRRDGQYLYPAFPYDHFTLVSDQDDRALYAFLMTRPPVRAVAPANDLPFPLDMRLIMFGWNVLFLHQGPYRADTTQSSRWNRGAYLAEGLGHCGACHTPRNVLGAEKANRRFDGSTVEGWTAYALDASSPAPIPWNAAALERYLHAGFDSLHGVARGPMAEVAHDLRTAPQDDVRAIATFVASLRPSAASPVQAVAERAEAQAGRGKVTAPQTADSQAEFTDPALVGDNEQGRRIYAGACVGCHEGPRAMPYGGIYLALSSSISGPSARNLVNVVLYGLPAAEAARSPIMPGFAGSLSDSQVAALARYLRARFSDKEPWQEVEADVRAARSAKQPSAVRHVRGQETAPPITERTGKHEAER